MSLPVAQLGRWLHLLETWVGTRRGRVVLFVLAVAVSELEGIASPLGPGRDIGNYLHYYLQLGDTRPVFLLTMLYREPVAPLLLGSSLDWGGRPLAEAYMAILYAGSVVAWSAAAAAFGRRASLFMAAALLLYPGYGILFHEFSSDAVFAAVFAGWALLVTRAALRPSATRFAVVGLGVGVLTLVRPGNEALLVFALFPLLIGHSWRQRVGSCAAFLFAAGALLGLLGGLQRPAVR
jgi:Dolichyl-phosphate-mannose-protein mannosyltransferase